MQKSKLFLLLLSVVLLSSCTQNDDKKPTNSSINQSSPSHDDTSNSNPINPDGSSKEELDNFFEKQAYIPEVITESITLPSKHPTLGNVLKWTIEEGVDYLSIMNNVLSLNQNVTSVSGVHAIKVSMSFSNYSYTYYCTSHHQNYHDLPVIDIHTENNEFPENKEDYVNGKLSVIDYKNEQYSLDLLNAEMGIRLRGNSTMAANKKPFRIKFEEKQSLFGLQKAKSWVLLANYYDKSNIRNYLAYTLANQMDNLGFQPSSIMVEVRFNNDFMGLYLLSEQIQSGKGRVDIEDDVDNQGYPSYFFELNERADDKSEGLTEDIDYFVTDADRQFIFEYKWPEEPSLEVNNYIKNYIIDTDLAITSLENYEDYIDVGSFIDYYIIQELFKNVDVGSSSQYYVKYANGKLHMGPVWDFDISLGVIGGADYHRYLTTDLWVRERDYWYNALFNDVNFLNQVKERYTEVHDLILQVRSNIDIFTKQLTKAQEANLQRWPLVYLTNPDLWIETHYHESYSALTNLNQHYQYLKNQLDARIELMDNTYLLS